MIDTIKIAQPISQRQYNKILESDAWCKTFDNKTGKLQNLTFTEIGKPFLTAFTAPDRVSYLSLRVSLPSFYNGSNARLLNQTQVWDALEMLSVYLSEKSYVDFDAMKAKVWEVHFTQDLKIDSNSLKPLLEQIAKMNISYFKNGIYRNSTAYFHSGKARSWCIYDKGLDTIAKEFSPNDIEYCKNMLRMELRYQTTASIRGLVKNKNLPNQHANTLFQQNLSDELINPIKEKILSMRKFSDLQEKLKFLPVKFGNRKASSLILHLILCDCFGDKYFEENEIKISRSAYYENQKICKDVNIFSLLSFSNPSNKINK